MNQKIVLLVLLLVFWLAPAMPSAKSNQLSTRRALVWFLPCAKYDPYWSNPEIFANISTRFKDTAFYATLSEKCDVIFLTDENVSEVSKASEFDLVILVDAMTNWTRDGLMMEAGKPILAINTGVFGLNFTFGYGLYPINTNITITEEHPILADISDILFTISNPTDSMCVVLSEVPPQMKIVASYITPFDASNPMLLIYWPTIDKKAVIVLCDWRSGDNPLKDQGLMSKLVYNVVDWLTLDGHDLNGDGKVNIIDISIVAKAFDSYPGHERWNPDADLNHDERINILDISAFAKCFEKTVEIRVTTSILDSIDQQDRGKVLSHEFWV